VNEFERSWVNWSARIVSAFHGEKIFAQGRCDRDEQRLAGLAMQNRRSEERREKLAEK
jgi:hypothetical protein